MKSLTKEDWEKWRNGGNIPMSIWFSFYKEKGGHFNELEEFSQLFQTLVNNRAIVQGSNGAMKEISPESAFKKMKDFYDKKFGF